MVRCSATVRTSGKRCSCKVNGDGSFCGRHGGLSKKEYDMRRRMMIESDSEPESEINRRRHMIDPDSEDELKSQLNNLRELLSVPGPSSAIEDIFSNLRNLSLSNSSVDLDYAKSLVDCSHNCYICLSDYDNGGCITNCCGKSFCKSCLKKWVKSNPSCPMCRVKLK